MGTRHATHREACAGDTCATTATLRRKAVGATASALRPVLADGLALYPGSQASLADNLREAPIPWTLKEREPPDQELVASSKPYRRRRISATRGTVTCCC